MFSSHGFFDCPCSSSCTLALARVCAPKTLRLFISALCLELWWLSIARLMMAVCVCLGQPRWSHWRLTRVPQLMRSSRVGDDGRWKVHLGSSSPSKRDLFECASAGRSVTIVVVLFAEVIVAGSCTFADTAVKNRIWSFRNCFLLLVFVRKPLCCCNLQGGRGPHDFSVGRLEHNCKLIHSLLLYNDRTIADSPDDFRGQRWGGHISATIPATRNRPLSGSVL